MNARILIVLVPVLVGGLSIGLGCRGKKTQSPGECMQGCEQKCPYRPDGLGDNEDYLECLEACEETCKT